MNKIFIGLSLCLLVAFAACSGEQTEKPSTQKQATPQSQTTGNNELTAWQLEHGIGPITESVKLGPIDEKLVQMGEAVFNSKCAACHKLEERYVGPPLGDVLARRTPEYVMNMALNPEEMLKAHPEVKKLLAQYYTPMPNQNITREEARAIVEYLRKNAPATK
jgi:mono/diheme cytochrome c family protein